MCYSIHRVDDNNVAQGQLGIALLTHSQIHSSKVILYKTKDQLLSTLVLKETVKLYWKAPYLQYHDDLSVFWSLFFSSTDDFNAFSEHLNDQCEIIRTPSEEQTQSNSKNTQVAPAHNITANSVNAPDEKVLDSKLSEHHDNNNDNETKTKADVMNRVVKVGHRIPLMTLANSTESVDSRVKEEIFKKSTVDNEDKPTIPDDTLKKQLFPTSTPIGGTPSMSYDFSVFTTEYRLQNTELRINLSKLDSKLDRVIDNIELLRLNAHSTNSPKSNNELEEEILTLEEKVLELKKENRGLKLQLQEMDLAKKQRLEQDTKDNSIIETLKCENDEKQSKIVELSNEVEELRKTSHNEIDELRKKMEEQIEALHKDSAEKSTEIEVLQQQMAESSKKSGELVRSILNEFYQKLYENISDATDISSADVLKLSADIIRRETKAALNSK